LRALPHLDEIGAEILRWLMLATHEQ